MSTTVCARARKAGFALWYEPAARGGHQVSVTSGGGLTPLKAYFRLRSGALYLSRHAALWERPLAWLAYAGWTAVVLARDYTAILLGGTPRARPPLAFARPARPR